MGKKVKIPGQKPRAQNGTRLLEGLEEKDYLNLYYYMRLTREFEMRVVKLYRQGKIVGGAYTGYGQEAISVGSAYALEDGDVLAPLHRDAGAHLVRGQSVRNMMCQYLGRRNGPTRGRDGNIHHGSLPLRIFAMISHLGAMIPVAAGAALAGLMTGQNLVAMTYIGDGGTSTGDFHEGLNFASVHKLPLIVIIENNQYAYSTPTCLQYACEDLVDRAPGYGIRGVKVDGNDVLEVYQASKEAVNRARSGKGPTLIEAKTLRIRGHSEHDDASYVPGELLELWKQRDPIDRFEKYLRRHRILTDQLKSEVEERILAEIEDAVEYAEKSPFPDGTEVLEGVYAG